MLLLFCLVCVCKCAHQSSRVTPVTGHTWIVVLQLHAIIVWTVAQLNNTFCFFLFVSLSGEVLGFALIHVVFQRNPVFIVWSAFFSHLPPVNWFFFDIDNSPVISSFIPSNMGQESKKPILNTSKPPERRLYKSLYACTAHLLRNYGKWLFKYLLEMFFDQMLPRWRPWERG